MKRYKPLYEYRIIGKDPKNEAPIKDDDVILLYHGFHSTMDALNVAKHGLSGKIRAKRLYSYEAGNNPYGLFVTPSIKVAREFISAHDDGVVMVFKAKASDLEAPVWAGGKGFFVQGDRTQSFNNDEERKSQVLVNRERDRGSDIPAVAQSDRPELANTLIGYGEGQALYVGDLNPNMIKGFLVTAKPEGATYHRVDDPWSFMSVKKFINKYGKMFKSNTSKPSDTDAENRFYKPNESIQSIDEIVGRIQKKYKFLKRDKIISLIDEWVNIDQNDQISRSFWPKQVAQLKTMFKK